MKSSNLIVSVPLLEPHRPPISVAIVAHAIELAGYPIDVLDLNIEFFHYLESKEKFFAFNDVWDRNRIIKLSEYKIVVKFLRQYHKKFYNLDRLMISVFGSSARVFTQILCRFIKKHHKHTNIVLGGQGVAGSDIGASNINFGQLLKDQGLADTYIAGEGEKAIVEYLQQNYNYPGINSTNYAQINELDKLPFPKYTYFDIDQYDWPDGKTKELFVVGSRGCVRKCTYCDVASYWPKFRYRSGQNIADELIYHYENIGATKFYFTDSLINGSLKSFRDMCDKLANYNQTHNAGFSWGGQLIWRPKHLEPPEYFEMIRLAGGDTFYVGVETGSDKIRWQMDKKFSNEDIDYALEQFNKNNLKVMFLMLMGYLTETKEDHLTTLDMFRRWQKYVATGTITGIDLGVSLTFLKDTPVEKMVDSHDVYFYSNNNIEDHIAYSTKLWESAKNPELTVAERIRRRLETHEYAIKYNWPIWRGAQRLESLKIMAREYRDFKLASKSNKTVHKTVNGLKYIKVLNL